MTFLDYKNEETIENLEKSFHINYFWRTKIDSWFDIFENPKIKDISLHLLIIN